MQHHLLASAQKQLILLGVLKLLNREVSSNPELTRRFEREADVVARLEHSGIVGVLDRGTEDGYLWIAMQYVRGTDAASWNAASQSPMTVVRLLAETASALDYAHSRGILHRDIKPANILIAEADGFRETQAILTDFGIAGLTEATDTKITATGTFTATLAYGSPEQLSGEVVDHRSDQYSLACTLFAMLVGRPPYAATNPGQVVMGHIAQPVPQLTAERPDLPAAIDTVLERAMAKQPADRFSTCTEFMIAVRDALEGREVAAHFARSAPTALNMQPNAYAAPAHQPGMRAGSPAWAPSAAASEPRRAEIGTPGELNRPVPPKGTAVTAGIATLVIGLALTGLSFFGVFLVIKDWAALVRHNDVIVNVLIIVVLVLLLALWNSAGLLLLAGRSGGRVLTVICSSIGTLGGSAALIWVTTYPGLTAMPGALVFVFLAAVSGIGLVCASAGATRRWVRFRTAVRIERYGY